VEVNKSEYDVNGRRLSPFKITGAAPKVVMIRGRRVEGMDGSQLEVAVVIAGGAGKRLVDIRASSWLGSISHSLPRMWVRRGRTDDRLDVSFEH